MPENVIEQIKGEDESIIHKWENVKEYKKKQIEGEDEPIIIYK